LTTKYFGKDVHLELTCDVGGARDQDLSTTQGTPDTVTSANTQSDTFVEKLNFDIDVSGDGPVTGTQEISIDVVSVTAELEYRFRAQFIDDADCTVTNSGTFSSTFTDAGIKTVSASLTFTTGDERLRISVECRKASGHGNQSLTVNVNDPDTFINAPWTIGPPPTGKKQRLQMVL